MIRFFLLTTFFFNAQLVPLSAVHYDPIWQKCIDIEEVEWTLPLNSFAEDVFDLPSGSFVTRQFSSPEDLAESGMTGPVFIVFEKGGAPLGVIKTFTWSSHQEREDFIAEYSAMALFQSLPPEDFHPVAMKGIEEHLIGETEVGLLGETFAPGQSINSYLKQMSKRSFNKKALYRELKAGVRSVAIGLASLHAEQLFSSPAPYYVEKYNRLKKEIGGESIGEPVPGPYGYIHGDTHPGNIYYDHKTGKAHFIDFGKSYPSRYGGPIAQDLANFLITLEMIGSYYNLTKDEIEELSTEFLSAYQEVGPEVSSEAIHTYRIYLLFLFAETFSDPGEKDDEALFFHDYLANHSSSSEES